MSLQRVIAAAVAIAAATVVPSAARAQDTTSAPIAAGSHARTIKHTVKRGDTLWDLAKYYLKDPHRWPDVFHANTNIVKNPHWIYPGQVLLIDADAVKPEIAAAAGFTPAQPAAPTVVVSRVETHPIAPTVFSGDESQTGRVDARASGRGSRR